MRRIWSIGGLLIGAAVAVFLAMQSENRRVFIAGDQPVTNDQVRLKLESDGWSNIEVTRKGRFIVAVASRNGQEKTIQVEALTGRMRITDDDDEVTDEDEAK
jgi:hypothetical protein